MTITKPTHGATNWDTATNAAIDILNLITPNGLNSDIQETARDAVGTALGTGGKGITVTVNDPSDLITIDQTTMPDPVNANGAGTNLFTGGTANVWVNLPTNPCTGSITNPSSTYKLICQITLGVWLVTPGTTNIRAGINWTGTDASSPDPGGGALSPPSNGFVPLTGVGSLTISFQSTWCVKMSASAVNNFTVQAQFDNTAGTKQVNYAGVQITPLRYTT